MFVVGYYLLLFLLSIVATLRYMLPNKKVDSRCAMVSVMIIINCFGRYLISISDTLEMAMFSNTLLYVGSLFSQLFMLLIVETICEFKVSKLLKGSMLLYNGIILTLVLTTK